MKKKGLAKIVRPSVPEKMVQFAKKENPPKYFVTAETANVDGRDILITNYFRVKNGDVDPELRMFCEKDDYISQDLTVEGTKWRTGSIENIRGHWWLLNDEYFSSHDMRVVEEWFDRNRPDLQHNVSALCRNVMEKRLEERHEETFRKIDREMERVHGIPSDYDDFVRNQVFDDDNYIFYSRSQKQAFCSRCGEDFKLTPEHLKVIRHNQMFRCPCCDKELMAKSNGMKRGGLYHIRWSVYVDKAGEDVVVRYFKHEKDMRNDIYNPKYSTQERVRTIHNNKESKDYMIRPYLGRYGEWAPYRPPTNIWGISKEIPDKVIPYWGHIDLSGTAYQYSGINEMVEHLRLNKSSFDAPWIVDHWFELYRKYPFVEKIVKVGFFNIIKHVLHDTRWIEKTGMKDGRNIREILGVSREKFKRLLRLEDPTIIDYMIIKNFDSITKEETEYLKSKCRDSYYDDSIKDYIDVARFTNIGKVIRYFKRKNVAERDYFEYVRWLDDMGYDMTDSYYLYPNDFKKAHDRVYVEYLKYRDEKKKEEQRQFDLIIKELGKTKFDIEPFRFSDNGLMIKVPEGVDDLKREGEVLHHCVGTYAGKVAEGKTIILFIRKQNKPDDPFYTMEWNGKIVQCRGMRNCNPTKDVKAFEDKFENEMKSYVGKNTKHAKAV